MENEEHPEVEVEDTDDVEFIKLSRKESGMRSGAYRLEKPRGSNCTPKKKKRRKK